MSVIIFDETKYFIALGFPGCWSYKYRPLSYEIHCCHDQLGHRQENFRTNCSAPPYILDNYAGIATWYISDVVPQQSAKAQFKSLISKIHTFFNFGNKIFTVSQY